MKSTHSTLSPIEALIRLERPVKELMKDLDAYDLESEGSGEDSTIVEYKDILYVLQRYIAGELEANDIFEWASELEMREDIQFGQEDQRVFLIIFKLSTPELEGPLTLQRAEKIVTALTAESPTDHDINKAYE